MGQPVAIERLVPIDIYPYSTPIDGQTSLRIPVLDRNKWRSGTVKKYGIGHRIGIQYDVGSEDDADLTWVDLSKICYRWNWDGEVDTRR